MYAEYIAFAVKDFEEKNSAVPATITIELFLRCPCQLRSDATGRQASRPSFKWYMDDESLRLSPSLHDPIRLVRMPR